MSHFPFPNFIYTADFPTYLLLFFLDWQITLHCCLDSEAVLSCFIGMINVDLPLLCLKMAMSK